MYSHQPLLITKKSHPPDVLEEIWGSGVGRRGVTQHVYQNRGLNGGFENTIGEILKEVFYCALSVFGVKPLNFFFRVQLMIKEMIFLFGTLFVHPQWRVGISYGKVIQAHGNTLIM